MNFRGAVINGVEVPAALRGVVSNGVEVPINADTPPPAPTIVVHEAIDFAQKSNYGWYFPTGVIGAGIDKEIYQVKAYSSTKTPPDPGVNPVNVIAVGSLSSTSQPTGVEVAGFEIHGTPQPHMYGGLRVASSKDAYIHDILIKGMPGDGAGPNSGNETFGVGAWHADGMHLKNVTIDGLDDNGNQVMATGVGLNFQDGVLIENLVVHHAVYGMGITWWECKSAIVRGADMRNNRKPVNLERCYDGKIDIYDMDVRGYTNNVPATCNSDQGSTVLTFYDPIWDTTKGPFKVGVAPNGYSGNQHQRVSDIHLVINGVDVSSDPTKLYVGSY